MNSLSAVLAADSATTIEYYGENGLEARYFKGANKIFQLSERHPVGVMIYNSAEFLGVPWEVSIKGFRRALADKSFNSVQGFADEFIEFVNTAHDFYPMHQRKNAFLKSMDARVFDRFFALRKLREEESVDVGAWLSDWRKSVELPSELPLLANDLSEMFDFFRQEAINQIGEIAKYCDVEISDDGLSTAFEAAFDDYFASLSLDKNYTGFAFAGFGDHSVFPELVHCKNCRFWGTKFAAFAVESQAVTHEIPAILQAFAQTSMIDTFSLGLSGEIFVEMQENLAVELKSLADEINGVSGGNLDEDRILDLVKLHLDSSKEKLFQYARKKHSFPLRRVLGFLPVDEMAELAETLINLQSLKEKVTQPSETVGGPVDVVAITRAEGLVWIKRKHYFKPELNSRYFDRRGR